MSGLGTVSEMRRDLIQKLLDGSVLLRPANTPLVGGVSNGKPTPLSYWQLHVWRQAQLAAQLAPGAHLFNETVTIHSSGKLDVEALERSLNEILRRHHAWRTTFRVVDGEPLQFVNPVTRNVLSVLDLSILPEFEREREALRAGTHDARQPFDLEDGPLVRTKLVRLSDDEWRLFLTVHQILLDGVSVYQVFLPELMAVYKAFVRNQASPLPELSVQYPDYAVWQRQWLDSDTLAPQMAYWQKMLGGTLAELRLPLDRPRQAQQTFKGSILPFAFPRKLSDEVRGYSQREGVTLFTTLLGVFYCLLHSYTAQDDVAVGTIAPTRQRSELQGLLGYFLNPIVLRVDLGGNPSFRELIRRARNIFLEALANSDAPFDSIVQMLQPKPILDRHPLYQVQISLEPPLPILDEGWNLTPMDFESGAAKLDLYLVFDDRPEGIIGRVQYNPDLFDASTVARMIEHYRFLLEAVLADPTRRISDLPHVTLRGYEH